jgi:hypothetical protein
LSGICASPDVPLRVHARYGRDEILTALGNKEDSRARVDQWREGVKWLPEPQVDAFVFTFDKNSSSFTSTTAYRDYAISPTLIHWESQSTTPSVSPTGKRYINHAERGSHVFLFCRKSTRDRGFWFLGPATYVRHKSSRPMQITWKLKHAIPGDLYVEFAAAVA